jgi:hypothetical protein
MHVPPPGNRWGAERGTRARSRDRTRAALNGSLIGSHRVSLTLQKTPFAAANPSSPCPGSTRPCSRRTPWRTLANNLRKMGLYA